MGNEDWHAQIRRGLLELCILSTLGRKAGYGYEIATRLAVAPALAAPEGTIYPLLRRLKKQGLLDAYWEESAAGPPRQYYRLSRQGQARLVDLKTQWRELALAVDAMVEGNAEMLEAVR